MARITVEDALKVVPNKYKLAILASQRASELFAGIAARVDSNDENGVKALREIALSKVEPAKLEEKIINSYRMMPEVTAQNLSDDMVDLELEALKKEMEGLTEDKIESDLEK
ncbi:MAG: DNA-directed RNA polymerase subunit omega, partial [Rickettsiales bacterium]|nr:DNA-directed RNA polymerase subunit omega [Rickettsiales bacterium]